ncbi:MAG TPA: NAD(P)H-dependent oxidoreductase [Bacteroidia bacterium]|nr:NAD(P)H-dependent oxidoreductase [Bacteroidia bacterium]
MSIQPTLSPDALLATLRSRYATKVFDPSREIPAEMWSVLEESLILSPSSFGLQPWKFLILRNPEIREKLVAHSWGQRQVADSSHFVVFAAVEDPGEELIQELLAATADTRGVDLASLEGYGNVIRKFAAAMSPEQRFEWSRRQAYIALGGFMTAAATLGIDTCPMEGFDPAAYDRELGLVGTGWRTAVACAAGYRADSDRYASLPKVRYSRDRLLAGDL